jgi:hypothetical protein
MNPIVLITGALTGIGRATAVVGRNIGKTREQLWASFDLR